MSPRECDFRLRMDGKLNKEREWRAAEIHGAGTDDLGTRELGYSKKDKRESQHFILDISAYIVHI